MKPWDKETPYAKGDKVTHNDVTYEAVASSWGVEPPAKAWVKSGTVIGKIQKPKDSQDISAPDYDANIPYSKDSIVKYNGLLYKAIDATWGASPPNPKAWIPLTSALPEKKVKTVKTDESINKAVDANVIIVEQHGYDGEDGATGPKGPKGDKGEPGEDGKSIEFKWEGTKLLLRREGDKLWTSVDLIGPKGDKGDSGKDGKDGGEGFSIIGGSRSRISSAGNGISLVKASKGSAVSLKSIKGDNLISITTTDEEITIGHTTPYVLTDAATIAVDASLSSHFRVTLGGNRTLGNPTNAKDGQRIMFEIYQDATGNRTLSLGSKFTLGTDITAITLSTIANKRDFLGAVYNATDDKFYVIAFVKGY